MRFFSGLAIAAGLLLVLASRADAQIAISSGYPMYGYPGSPYGYNAGYGGFGSTLGAPWGVTSYNSAYSVYTAPGTASFSSGYYAPNVGYPAYGYPVYGYPAYGYAGPGFGYAAAPYAGGRSFGYASTGLFMGLPRPFAGLVRVPR
jgi:hypothetical protein